MHPALVVLVVVLFVHVTGLVGRERIEAAIRPVFLRVAHGNDVRLQKKLKADIYTTRQQLNKTSSQDEFAKWARLRRQVDKMVGQLEATNARLANASSVVSLLVRAVLFLSTTLFPFVLTFYYGKVPMFYLPPSDSPAAVASTSRAAMGKRMAPGGFEIPQDPGHAWGILNETYLGPLGWLLSMTAAPRGSVSAGMWSTICTRVAILATNQVKDVFVALFAREAGKQGMTGTTDTSDADDAKITELDDGNEEEKKPTASSMADGANMRKRSGVVAS